jgi:hypothetical protein
MKGRITRSNYEAWLLDRLEGSLTAGELEELQHFLVLHPEIDSQDSDLNSFALPDCSEGLSPDIILKKEHDADTDLILNYIEGQLPALEKIEFENRLEKEQPLQLQVVLFRATQLIPELQSIDKNILLRTEEDLLMQSPVLRYIEKQLSATEQKEFLAGLKKSPALLTDTALFDATRLIADQAILYPDKKGLIKSASLFPLFGLRRWQFAAAAILLLLLFSFLFRFSQVSSEPKRPLALKSHARPVLKNSAWLSEGRAKKEIKKKFPDESLVKKSLANHLNKSLKKQVVTAAEENLIVRAQLVELDSSRITSLDLNNKESTSQKYASVEELQEIDDSPEINLLAKGGNFWHRAVDLAKRVNQMGFKSINGMEEIKTRSYRLSFNSFSVEKK